MSPSFKQIAIHPEVRKALRAGAPVVALESTIIAHGMPYPRNVETAREVETEIRERGAVPATIAVIDGIIRVGLTPEELKFLGRGKDILKAGRRDLPFVVARKLHAATTVSATMIGAAMARIRFFATGGIGGVHREGHITFDISSDLQELARTDVAVVSAGAKAILDLPLTLEYLETFGVPVIGFGTDRFPAFYTRDSGLAAPFPVGSAREAADIIRTKWAMGLSGGILIANPIPKENAMDPNIIDEAIEKALAESKKRGIKGKEVTPFLLSKIKDITAGTSLEANIALVKNNARVAAEIASAYS